jgi:hypothetical protein
MKIATKKLSLFTLSCSSKLSKHTEKTKHVDINENISINTWRTGYRMWRYDPRITSGNATIMSKHPQLSIHCVIIVIYIRMLIDAPKNTTSIIPVNKMPAMIAKPRCTPPASLTTCPTQMPPRAARRIVDTRKMHLIQ